MIIGYKEVSVILQLSFRHAQRRLTEIKTAYGKKRKQKLTIIEFCEYEAIPMDFVKVVLKIK